MSLVGPIAYFGPPATAERLATVAALRHDEAVEAPPARRKALLQSKAWHWKEATAPHALFDTLAKEAGVKIVGVDKLPHDLWAAADLPPLSWTDRLTLVAVQFDRTFEIDASGATVRLVPLPDKVQIERSYPGGGRASELAQRGRAQLPTAEVRAAGDKVVVTGRIEDQQLIERALRGQPAKHKTVTAGKQVYTLARECAGGRIDPAVGRQAQPGTPLRPNGARQSGHRPQTDGVGQSAERPAGRATRRGAEACQADVRRKASVLEIRPAK